MLRIIKIIGIILLFSSVVFATSRVSFSRPGNMMNIPSGSNYIDTESFIIGVSSDIYNFTILNQSSMVNFNTQLNHNINIGFTIGTLANPSNDLLNSTQFKTPVEFGLHYQHRVYSFKDISISLGIQDLIFNSISGFDANSASIFTVFSSERKFEQYILGSYIGAGTGKIAANNFFYDDVEIRNSYDSPDNDEFISEDAIKDSLVNNQKANVFLGFILKTPYLFKNGGIDILAEYDGSGLNIGIKIPLSPRYVITTGIKNLQNISDLNRQFAGSSANFYPDYNHSLKFNSSSIHFGVSVKLPKTGKTIIIPRSLRRVGTSGKEFAERVYKEELDSSLIYFEEAVGQLRDSLRLINFKLQTLNNHNQLLNQKLSFLGDSTEALRIKQNISDHNQNKIVKHLTKSLKHYYDGDYISALQEVEISIELNPNMAVAYARRGSIYYQLGDIKRARINWNMALKLDPDYDEVRNILSSANDNQKKDRL